MSVRDQERFRNYVGLISRSVGGLEALPEQPIISPIPAVEAGVEAAGPVRFGAKGRKSLDERMFDAAVAGAQKLAKGDELSPEEIAGVEAIIIPDKRPAFDIVDGDFIVSHPLWTQLTDDEAIHERLVRAIPLVGRIELLNQSRIPYGGTVCPVGARSRVTCRRKSSPLCPKMPPGSSTGPGVSAKKS